MGLFRFVFRLSKYNIFLSAFAFAAAGAVGNFVYTSSRPAVHDDPATPAEDVRADRSPAGISAGSSATWSAAPTTQAAAPIAKDAGDAPIGYSSGHPNGSAHSSGSMSTSYQAQVGYPLAQFTPPPAASSHPNTRGTSGSGGASSGAPSYGYVSQFPQTVSSGTAAATAATAPAPGSPAAPTGAGPGNTITPDVAVFGQLDLVSNIINGTPWTSSTLYSPIYVDRQNGKWIVSTGDSRLLFYSGSLGAAPDLVLGGAPALRTGASSFYWAAQVAWDGTHFAVADSSNNRVLIWNSFPTRNYQPADVVIGQPNFVSYQINQGLAAPTASTLSSPYGVLFLNGKLVISDFTNNRLLIYNSVPTTNGAPADIVIGQADFVSAGANRGGAGPTSTSLNGPSYLATDGVRLIATDYSNNRVVIWNTLPASQATAANLVLGQATFTTAAAATTQAGLNGPNHVAVIGGAVYVTDYMNHRIQYWATFPVANGQAATGSIGQPDFVSGTQNRGAATPVANGFSFPWNVATDGTSLVVSDSNNNRLLVFGALPTGSADSASAVYGQASFTAAAATPYPVSSKGVSSITGLCASSDYLVVGDNGNNRFLVFDKRQPSTPAIAVIGQPNFTSTAAGTSATALAASQMSNTCAVGSDGKLYLSDTGNNRVLIYNRVPTASGTAADLVLGHDLFTQSAANDGAAGAGWLSAPKGLFATATQLFVADSTNNRTLIFNLPITANHQPANVVVGQPDFTTLTAGPTQLKPNGPLGVTTDGTRLFVGDANRVMVYNAIPGVANVNADFVIGQANFTAAVSGSGANLFATATGRQPAVVDGYLYVPDPGNFRALGFDLSALANGMNATRALTANPYALSFDAGGDYFWIADAWMNRAIRIKRSALSSYVVAP